jgi:gluconate transporter
MPILYIALSILLLLILMLYFKVNAFLSLTLSSIFLGFICGLGTVKVIEAMQKGFGDILGSLTFILVFGAMLGKIIADSGAAYKISSTLSTMFGKKRMVWAVVLTGFIVGIPLFYTAGFVLLIPLVFTISALTNVSPVVVGIPMAAALSVTHGFLPPHPGPVAIAGIFKADIGKTLLYGIFIAIPAIIFAGPLFSQTLKDITAPSAFSGTETPAHPLPSFRISLFTSLFPVLLIAFTSIIVPYLETASFIYQMISFFGNPVVAMLMAVLFAVYLLMLRKGKNMSDVMESMNEAITDIALILLIIGAGGAFKQVLIATNAAEYLAGIFRSSELSPLILAWTAAAVIRLALGSATVAAITSAGIILPLMNTAVVSPELMVLAIGAGSLMFSHVNDAGFWIFKEYFNLTVVQTIQSWSIMETIVSVTGLIGVLILEMIIS